MITLLPISQTVISVNTLISYQDHPRTITERVVYLDDKDELVGGTESGDVTFKEDVGGKKCFQIDEGQSIDITTTPGIKKYTMIFNVYYDNSSWKSLD